MTHAASPARTRDVSEWVLAAYFGTLAAAWLLPIALFLVDVHFTPGTPAWAVPALVAASVAATIAAYHPPPSYWRLRPVERGALYRRLGVRAFGALVVHGALMKRWLRRHGSPAGAAERRATLGEVARRTALSERMHLAGLGGALPFVAAACLTRHPGWAWYFVLANVAHNLYPVLLQRDTRARLERVGTCLAVDARRSGMR